MTSIVTDLREFGTAAVLDAAVAARRNADLEEARLLSLAVHWVDLHPVTDQNPAASSRCSTQFLVDAGDGTVTAEPPLAGAGTPGIAEFAVEELAAALGLGYQAGLRLVAEAVEPCFRLPRLWELVQSGVLQAWGARAVAAQTVHLSGESVAFVDRHLAVLARRGRIPAAGKLRALVHEARLRCDPDQAAAVEQAALDARGVWFDHRESTATTDLTARLDTLDALDLEGSISDLATEMGRLGDTRPIDVRRAGALGVLAHPQRALDLVHGPAHDPHQPSHDSRGPGVGAADGLNGSHGTLYLHVSRQDLGAGTGGSVEKLGAGTLELLRDWLQRTKHVTIRPVLDLDRRDAVDQHDPPPWMREIVILRDGYCVFPSCQVDARVCDLDHIQAYLSPDDGGPPGQTAADNLACLCRRHHRLKTFTAWSYQRLADNTYAWTSPTGRTTTVTAGHR